MKIFKYQIGDDIVVMMPKGAKVLCIQEQYSVPNVWAMVDPSASLEARRFVIYGTGHEMRADRHTYVGTFQMYQGALVFHVFELHTAEQEVG